MGTQSSGIHCFPLTFSLRHIHCFYFEGDKKIIPYHYLVNLILLCGNLTSLTVTWHAQHWLCELRMRPVLNYPILTNSGNTTIDGLGSVRLDSIVPPVQGGNSLHCLF